ncbi:histidine kinase [Streptomyces sp. AcH 505]|nr:histidine kinase [Streptomyces sp. AcH 505]
MQKKRPRGNGGMTADTPGEGRRKRVRSRLFAGVAVIAVTVVAAGVPGVLDASTRLNDAQRLVTLAELNRQTVTLAHSLADERDEAVVYVAAGRPAKGESETNAKDAKDADGHQVSRETRARVDRQIDEIRATGSASAGLLRDLSTVPSVRASALTGKDAAPDTYRAYSDVIDDLHAVAERLAERAPAEVAGDVRASVDLDSAVDRASGTRALLLGALAVPADEEATTVIDPVTGLPVPSSDDLAANKKNDAARDALSAAAQQTRTGELAALADFDRTADSQTRDSLARTVTGPDITAADGYLKKLTDRPELSESERSTDQEKVRTALSARIDQMRGVEAGLGSDQLTRLEKVRDDDVTALELRFALLGGLLLIAVGVATAVARTLTRPLAVLRIGAARLAEAPGTAEPVRFTGRNDEFAQVVRSLNALHSRVAGLLDRPGPAGGETTVPIGASAKAAARGTGFQKHPALQEHTELHGRTEPHDQAELQERAERTAAELAQLRNTVEHTFVNLSLRSLGLVERQLGVIESLEEREQDPDRLATLYKLDHLATVMRRHSENLLVLAEHEHGHSHPGPVPLVDMLRAAVSEIERYERITIQSLPSHAQVAGFAADDLSHLVAELLENATSFSPPDAQVELSGWLLESGEVMISVQDKGIGMPEDRLGELNALLDEATQSDRGEQGARDAWGTPGAPAESEGLGLRVAALLAARHGVRVHLRKHEDGGLAAVVVLPQALLPETQPSTGPVPAAAYPPPTAGPAPAVHQPGSVAEANSNALPARQAAPDPLIAAAEETIREAESEPAAPAGVRQDPYAVGPDTHERADVDQDTFTMRLPRQQSAEPEPAPVSEPAVSASEPAVSAPEPEQTGPESDPVTDKGLPKRTPKVVKAATSPTERTGSVDAEELRRRLGGFHQGAKDGRRDVEAELTESSDRTDGTDPIASGARDGERDEEAGETVEEARS